MSTTSATLFLIVTFDKNIVDMFACACVCVCITLLVALPLCHMSLTHGNNSTDLADQDKALERAQIFELFVQKCSLHLTLGLVYHIKLLFQTVVRLWRSPKPPTVMSLQRKSAGTAAKSHAGVCVCVCVKYLFFFSQRFKSNTGLCNFYKVFY